MHLRTKTVADGGIQIPPGNAASGMVWMGTDTAGNGMWNPRVELGPFDIAGDSHISEYGPSTADYGIAQKIAGALLPGVFRTCALGGAIQAGPDLGNGTTGDGGWAHIAGEYHRQEQSTQKYNSTITQSQAGSVTSYTVASVVSGATPVAGEWVVLGAGANTEVIQISQSWNGASPITFQTATANAHTTGDPIYHACRNEGYLAKSAVVFLCAEGANDLGFGGPGAPPSPLSNTWQSGTFGTTIGASAGNGPFMQALRFTLAQLRCSVIYADTHPSIVYGTSPGTWTSNPVTSTASYPTLYTPFTGGAAGNFHSATVNASTITFATAPDFPGGTVVAFMTCASTGQGALWDYSVAGATTIAMTSHAAGSVYDNRNMLLYPMNNANTTTNGLICGTCIRITGLNAGVNTITLKATTINSLAAFLGWGIEAPIPPLIVCAQTSRVPGFLAGSNYTAGPGSNYNRRTVAATGATVAPGAGTVAGAVTFTGGTVALATAGVPSPTLAQINDTITLDKGVIGKEETRRIVGFTGSPATACQVDANFTQQHTAAAIQIGLQDADYVGGGYYNTSDTQGALSVPGLAACVNSVVAEFDASVIVAPFDPVINGGSGTPGPTPLGNLNFYADGVHYNDRGSGLIAASVTQLILAHATTIPSIASATVPNKRTYNGIYGDVGATPAPSSQVQVFANGFTNVYSSTLANATTYAKTGYYKDPRTRTVFLRGAITGGIALSGAAVFTLPAGMFSSSAVFIQAITINEDGTYGIANLVLTAGILLFLSGYPGASGLTAFNASWLADL